MKSELTKNQRADCHGKNFFGKKAGEDEFDFEIKRIFDDLRAIGNPQNHSLDETLSKAIAAERKLMKSGEKIYAAAAAPRTAANRRLLLLREVTVSLLLTVMAISIIHLSTPSQASSDSIAGGVNKSRIDFR